MSALSGGAHLFTLTPADIGLSDRYSDPSVLYGPELGDIFDALARAFKGPFYAVIEVGTGSNHERGHLHIHVIAHSDDGPPHIPRGGERCKPVTDPVGLYRYLAKAQEPYSLEAHLDLSAAEVLSSTGRPPRTRRHFLGPQRLAWATQCTNDLTLTPTPSTRGDQPAPRRALRLADLFARTVADSPRTPARPLHERLKAPERLPAPRRTRNGLDPGPAP